MTPNWKVRHLQVFEKMAELVRIIKDRFHGKGRFVVCLTPTDTKLK
jgi:hypothetical protein